MNRPTAYFLILLGAPLGFIGSYFMQPGILRTFDSLGDYLSHAIDVLSVPPGDGSSGRSIFLTGWAGVALGVLVMAILATVLGIKKSTEPLPESASPNTDAKPADSKSQEFDKQLRTLAKLREDGVITQEDFERKKREILGF